MTPTTVAKIRKTIPAAEPDLLFRPETDRQYVLFENGGLHPFDHGTAAFSRVNAWWLADAALLAYWDEAPAKAIWNSAGFDSTFHYVPGSQCHLAWTPELAIATFRGTEPDDFQDILDIIRLGTRPWPQGGRVHEGFLDAFTRIWGSIEGPLRAIAATRPVWFTGHSLGGALATLAVDRFGSGQLYTVGSPRVGDRAFATGFNARHSDTSFRYVNNIDLVGELPPTGWLLRYLHINARRFIADDGAVSNRSLSPLEWWRVSTNMEAVKQAMDRRRHAPTLPLPRLLADHTPRRYAVHAWNDYAGV